jgi:nitroreductase
MKKIVGVVIITVCLLCGGSTISGRPDTTELIEVILSSFSAKQFTAQPVPESAITQILLSGAKAPSARNSQPWKFTVLTDVTKAEGLVKSMQPGSVVILISGQEAEQPGINVDFDCALATANMYLAAQSLGFGAHIYTGPVQSINTTMRDSLQIPEGYRVVSVLQIGALPSEVDATSSASPRKPLEELVNYAAE